MIIESNVKFDKEYYEVAFIVDIIFNEENKDKSFLLNNYKDILTRCSGSLKELFHLNLINKINYVIFFNEFCSNKIEITHFFIFNKEISISESKAMLFFAEYLLGNICMFASLSNFENSAENCVEKIVPRFEGFVIGM